MSFQANKSLSLLLFAIGLLGSCAALEADELQWELGPTGTKASLRGISAPNNQVIWATGSQATVVVSQDGGNSWDNVSPEGFKELEFRSVHAWSRDRACIASAGTPAVILLTEDGGVSWNETHREASDKAFFDGLKFWDAKNGIAFSDPVGTTLLIVESKDGGRSWETISEQKLPKVREGEAGFAASNSSLAIASNGRVWIGTGGAKAQQSRIHYRSSWGAKWGTQNAPLPSEATQGIFSIAVAEDRIIAVGGDYRPEALSPATAAVMVANSELDLGVWEIPSVPPPAYRSSVVQLSKKNGWIAVGPTGSDYSDTGDQWKTFSEIGFHALAVGGDSVFAVGSDGRFAVLKVK